MKQLKMENPMRNVMQQKDLPSGYSYEIFNGTQKDIDDWKKLMQEQPALGPERADECYRLMVAEFSGLVPTKDIHFVVNTAGERIASISTVCLSEEEGCLHMLKVSSRERGKGIGQAMVSYALGVFEKRKIKRVTFLTDDFRLPAIKTCLNAGFLPVIFFDPESNVESRWKEIFKQLNRPKSEMIFH